MKIEESLRIDDIHANEFLRQTYREMAIYELTIYEKLQEEERKGSAIVRKIGDTARVIETRSVFYGEIVTFLEEDNKNYVFINKKHNCARLIVAKDSIDDYVEWKCKNNDA